MLSIPTRISEIFTCSCPALEEDGPGLVDDHHLVIVISIFWNLYVFQSCNLEASLDNLADSISTNHVQLATKNSHCMNLWNFYVFKLVLLWLVQFHATIKHGFEDRSFWFLHSFPRISGSFTCLASFYIPFTVICSYFSPGASVSTVFETIFGWLSSREANTVATLCNLWKLYVFSILLHSLHA